VENRSVIAVTGLTEPARLLKPTGNRPLTVATKPSFSANRSVWSVNRSDFVEFENRYCSSFLNPDRVHKTTENWSFIAVTGLTEPDQLLKPTGNRPLTVPTKPSISANHSVWSVNRSGFVEFENRYCSGFLNPDCRWTPEPTHQGGD
jgi:hypothetical protein